jgi:DHA1 family multidrug resistance protein-like MFS transporter
MPQGSCILSEILGPIFGPVIGFPAQLNGWKWPIYELIWISGFALLFLAFLLPETYGPTILLKRAARLRKLTGNPHLRSQSEIDSASTTASDRLYEALVRPFVLAAEPALLFANVYMGFVCEFDVKGIYRVHNELMLSLYFTDAVFYLWFEAFPLVFLDIYHFDLALSGLPFLAFIVTGVITVSRVVVYYHLLY